MKEFIVEHTREENGVLHAVCTDNETVIKNLVTNFGTSVANNIIALANKGDDFHATERFCQFVGLIYHEAEIGFSLQLTNYQNYINAALDEYSQKMGKGWDKQDTDKCMQIIQDIADNPGEFATLKKIDSPLDLFSS